MAKLLRVLVIILLLLSVGALTLGIMLFNRREILKIRTQKLENTLIALGFTIEGEEPESPGSIFPGRDVSPVTSEVIDNPETAGFWEDYNQQLEVSDLPKLNLEDRKEELMSYYLRDPETGKPKVNEITGMKVTEGPGTMEAVLEDVLGKAESQLARLNATREELIKTREELVTTITDLNQRKDELRKANKKIDELEAEIQRLNNKIADLEAQIRQLEAQIQSLKDEIDEKERQISELEEALEEEKLKYEDLEEKYVELKNIVDGLQTREGVEGTTTPVLGVRTITRGKKGSIAAVDAKYHFVAIDVSDKFIAEIFKDREEDEAGVPEIEMVVKRPGEDGKYVTKVKLVQIRKQEKVAVANILTNWQQLPVKQGDVVYY